MCDRTKKIFLVLWGMAGAGKSTIGKRLAQTLNVPFIDTDDLLEADLGSSLQQGLDDHGYLFMREREGAVLAEAEYPSSAVIATGGSAVYSRQAVARLKALGLNVFLDVSMPVLMSRVNNWHARGFNRAPGQSIEDVFQERRSLYRQAAHFHLDCDKLSEEQVLQAIVDRINARK